MPTGSRKQQKAAAPMPRPRSVRGRPSAARSEEITKTILREAAAMFLADGYEATSMEAIAAQAGIPRTTLYKRFSDKNELLKAVIATRRFDWSLASAKQEALIPDNLEERLTYLIMVMIVGATRHEIRQYKRLASQIADPSQRAGSRREGPLGYEGMLGAISETVRRLAPTQGITPKNPDHFAEMLMSMVAGWIDGWAHDEEISNDEAMPIAKDMADLLIKGAAAW